MAKLVYRTKEPRKGYTFHQADMTHEKRTYNDPLPSEETQKQAMSLVCDKLHELTIELEKLGYDPTKVRFQIHTK